MYAAAVAACSSNPSPIAARPIDFERVMGNAEPRNKTAWCRTRTRSRPGLSGRDRVRVRHQAVLFRGSAFPMTRSKSMGRAAIGLGLLLHAATAAAYIDPGTGSALFYVVSGIVV